MITLLTVLSVARLTRLVTADFVFAGPRARLIQRLGVQSKLAYLVTCPWCMSMWVAGAVAPLWWWYGSTPGYLVPAMALAASYVVGLLASAEGEG